MYPYMDTRYWMYPADAGLLHIRSITRWAEDGFLRGGPWLEHHSIDPCPFDQSAARSDSSIEFAAKRIDLAQCGRHG